MNVIVNELLSSLKKIKEKKICMFFNLVYYRNSWVIYINLINWIFFGCLRIDDGVIVFNIIVFY